MSGARPPDHRPVGFPTAAPAPGGPLRPPGPPIVRYVVTEQAKLCERPGWGLVTGYGAGETLRTSGMGAFCKPSRKRPFIANICSRSPRAATLHTARHVPSIAARVGYMVTPSQANTAGS